MNFWSLSRGKDRNYTASSDSRKISKRGEETPMSILNGGRQLKVDDLDSRITQVASSSSGLPAPVSASSKRKKAKTARIERSLRSYWTALIKRMSSGTDPGDSDSINDTAGESTEDGHWKSQPQVTGVGERSKDSAAAFNQTLQGNALEDEDSELYDEIVVDRTWGSQYENEKSSESPSDHIAASPEKSGTSHHPEMTADGDSAFVPASGIWLIWWPLTLLRYRLYPAMLEFFTSKFHDAHAEDHYRKEIWFTTKPLAMWSALFYVLNWVLGCALVPKPFELADKIYYFGVAVVFTIPVPFMVMYDWPRDRPVLYQIFLTFSTWIWSIYQLLFIYLCGFYSHHGRFMCGEKDFLATFYYTTALQTIALFGLKQNRLQAMFGAIVFLALMIGLVVPFRVSWIRNVLNFIAFQAFLLYIHYMREIAERRLYTLRDQLKVQYKATQKAQLNERKEADSKRRLTSYVFHDKVFVSAQVRVPLNTALIAVQNMEAYGVIRKGDDAAVEFSALQGSLSMMSKVLNDVLDFNRLDSGRFEFSSRPYSLHQAMRSMFVPLRLATNARGLELVTHLDPDIDEIARRSAYEARGYDQATIERLLRDLPNEDGIVVGDEMRLRQIVTNLASNACKFTPTGGKLNISTKLILPEKPFRPPQFQDGNKHVEATGGTFHDPASDNTLNKHNLNALEANPPPDRLVFRIEVTDTGVGIKRRDISRGRLFSAFNQTEQGRQQGGKGTGLGLALTRHIVKLSGGRLGVRSQVGKGSTFWVELPVAIGKRAAADSQGGSASARSEGKPSISSGSTSVQGNYQQTLRQDDVALRFEAAFGTADEPISKSVTTPLTDRDRSSSFMTSASSQAPSALQSIMEQGGLVEIAANRHSDKDPLPTRTIGDLSTGTESSQDFVGATSDRHTSQDHSVRRPRPTHVDLPGPPTFTFQGSSALEDIHSNSPNYSPCTPKSGLIENPIRVLVVDDDPLTRKLMQRMLLRLGCRVSTAGNGLIALDLITGDGATPYSEDSPPLGKENATEPRLPFDDPRYEIIFLDNQMPVLSGIDTVARLRSSGRHDLLVVGVTGNALLSDQQEYLEAGADHVITKPVREPEIKHMLTIACSRRKQNHPKTMPP